MPFNVLILPLLGGYIFISHWNVTRFGASRYSGQRLIFHAAIAGVVWLIIGFVITHQLSALLPQIRAWWYEFVPFAYSGTSTAAFLMGATLWYPLNWAFKRERWAVRAVEDRGDFLETLLNRAISSTDQVMVTLSNGKVYVGFVTSNFDPAFDRKYMQLMPILSGYRDQHTRDLIITNDYAKVYKTMIEGDNPQLAAAVDKFQLVIPVQEVVSANLFDPGVYEIFSRSAETTIPAVAGGGSTQPPA